MQLGSRFLGNHLAGYACALLFVSACGTQGSRNPNQGGNSTTSPKNPFDYEETFGNGGGSTTTPSPIGSSGGGGGPSLEGSGDGGEISGEDQQQLGDELEGLAGQLRQQGGGDSGQLVGLLLGLAAQAHREQMEKKAFAKALLTALMVKQCIEGVKKAKAQKIQAMNPKQKRVFQAKTATACYVKTMALLKPKLAATILGISQSPGTIIALMKQVFGK